MIFIQQEWMDYAVIKDGRYYLKNDAPEYIKKEYAEYQEILNNQFNDIIVNTQPTKAQR